MIVFHASPEEHLTKIIMEFEKVEKLTYWFNSPVQINLLNKLIPNAENMKKPMNTSVSILYNDGSMNMSVSMSIFNVLAFFNSLNTLRILNIRIL